MDTKTLREAVTGMISNCNGGLSDATAKQREVAESRIPALLWDVEAMEAASLTQLKLAHNSLNTMLGKLQPAG